MHQAHRGPSRQPILANPPFDPPRILTEAAPTLGSAPQDDVSAGERRVWFDGGSGIELHYPARLAYPSPWIGHIPFAFWLVEALRPRVIVELGVHSGNSYCAFLQAAQSLSLSAQCYGIDHWRGDGHTEHYSEDVYTELCSYHEPLYGTFSTLIRATFEDALPYFADSSIDLLHIDGFHTYEAVEKDFSDWLPKMSARGVVLFHDINVREKEFGVWQFWEEIAARYPTLAFVHSHGLGLAYVGTDAPTDPLRTLLAPHDPDSISRTRVYFGRLGTSLVDRFARREAEGIAGRVRASEAGLEAARAEISRHVESVGAIRFEVGNANAQVAILREELAAGRAEGLRQIEAAARLQQELAKATDRIALLEDELATTRAESTRQLDAADASRATAEEMTGQVAALREELLRARDQGSQAITQRERATQLLRQQITTTLVLQRELAATRSELARQLEAATASRTTAGQGTALWEQLFRARGAEAEVVAALVTRLAPVKRLIPRPIKRYLRNRIVGPHP